MTENKPANDSTDKEKTPVPAGEESISKTHHTIRIKGDIIEYSVTTGTIILKEEDFEEGEKQKASIFYIAYTKDEPEANRPITFSFNGGPGSSSVWMHLGLIGPKRVLMTDEGEPVGPPYQLVDNEFSLFDQTDLVFIDPVSTGYSRTVPKEKPDQFHTVKKDIQSVGDFIRVWTTRNQRWASPKFLIGESYGTTRAAGLAGYLHQRHGMYLNGIMFISSILNFITAQFDEGNDLPYILFLPTYTATAWYHHKLSDDRQVDLEKAVAEARDFALNEYTLALMKGNALKGEERQQIIDRLSALTGLSKAYIEGTNLRINIHRFCKELLRDRGLTVGRLDSRYTGFDQDSVGEVHEVDPSYTAILGPYTATMYNYLRSELGYETDLPYEVLTSLYQTWKYEEYQNHYVNTASDLRQGFQYHPGLKVIVCNGYYDLATPLLATEYTFNHIPLPEAQQRNIQMKYYPAGHMMYLHLPSLEKVSEDLHAFIMDPK
ncbi:MAG TPA: peptidase S10 [Anaerolineaceae bacterium]|nr:peptidase S10 [Anaerolineaceae bacterium]